MKPSPTTTTPARVAARIRSQSRAAELKEAAPVRPVSGRLARGGDEEAVVRDLLAASDDRWGDGAGAHPA
jgi:hypothetical protein